MKVEDGAPLRFSGMARRVNLFLIAAVISVLGAVALVSYKQGMFVRHTQVIFYAVDAFGINKGMVVKLFGLPVGSVKSMVITDRGVKVELSIISENLVFVPKGSHVRLLREGYIGAASLQLVPDPDSKGAGVAVVAGDVIDFLPNRGVAELIDEFKNQVAPVLVQLQRAAEEINRPDSDFRKSATSARILLGQLPDTNLHVQKLVRDLDRSLQTLSPEALASVASANRIGAQVELQLPAIAEKLNVALVSLTEAARQVGDQAQRNGEVLNETLKQVPALMREGGKLVREGGELVREGRETLGAARNVWPLSSGIEKRTMSTLAVDSFEAYGQGQMLVSPQAPR